MKVTNIIIDGLKKHEKVELNELLELVHKGYEKYNLEDVTLNIIAGNKHTEVLKSNGIRMMGDNEYEYSVARTKDTKERINIAVFNFEKKYKADYLQNVATAMGDILAHQYERFIPSNQDEEFLIMVRSPFAVAMASLMLKEISYRAATKFEYKYRLNNIPFDKVMKMSEFSATEKLNAIVELIAYGYAVDKTLDDFWNSSSDLYKSVLELESKLRNAYDKFLKQEKLEDKEMLDIVNEIKGIRNQLR